jgi:hypothetical protein
MKRHTEAKRQVGFGAFVEIPSCIYATGTLLGVLDYYQDVIYYVLPVDLPDLGANYVRCKRWRPAEQLYIPGPLQPWNDNERTGSFIPTDRVARVIHFSRGMFNQRRYEALLAGQEGRTRDQERARLYGAYVGRFERLVSRYRYWGCTLDRFVALLPDRERQAPLQALLAAGDFDLLVPELERIKTDDPEPPELLQASDNG